MSRASPTSFEGRRDSLLRDSDGQGGPTTYSSAALKSPKDYPMADVALSRASDLSVMTDTLPPPFPGRLLLRQTSSGQNLPSLRSMGLPSSNSPSTMHARSISDNPLVLQHPHGLSSPHDGPPGMSPFGPSSNMMRGPPPQARPVSSSLSQGGSPTDSQSSPASAMRRESGPNTSYKFMYHSFQPYAPHHSTDTVPTNPNGRLHLSPRSSTSRTKAAYLGQQNVQGKGLCHVYDDGNYLPVTINGNPVHPAHGVTKTGLPAKRTHAACLNCRSKKVKCEEDLKDPSRPCLACAKGGLDCQWYNRSKKSGEKKITDTFRARSSTKSPETSSRPDSSSHAPSSSRPQSSSRPGTPLMKRRIGSSEGLVSIPDDGSRTISSGSDGRPYSAGTEVPPMKRAKYSHGEEDSPTISPHDTRPASMRQAMSHASLPAFGINVDPYMADPHLTSILLEKYFDYRDRGTSQVFPKSAFLEWVMSSRHKSTEDLLLLYSCLVLGSIYATGLKQVGSQIADIIRELEFVTSRDASLQLVAGRLNLGMYYAALGHCSKSFEIITLALRTTMELRYNEEAGCQMNVSDIPANNEFRLSKFQTIECRRRAFWVGYLAAVSRTPCGSHEEHRPSNPHDGLADTSKRFNGYCTSHACLINDEDIYVRVPNPEADFEAGLDTVGPLFNEGKIDLMKDTCGDMGFLVSMVYIWGTVTTNIYRSQRRDQADYVERYESFYEKTTNRLEAWESALPPHLKYTPENTRAAADQRRLRSYYVLQACYHVTAMTLNRYCRLDIMSESSIRRNIKASHHYAHQFLLLITAISKLNIPDTPSHADIDKAICQPFPGYAILVACDILSRGGPASSLDDTSVLVSNADAVVAELARIFSSAKHLRRLIQKRVREFGAHKMKQSRSSLTVWDFREPCETGKVPLEFDVIYGVSDSTFHEAVR